MKKLINKAVNNIMENLATRVAKLVPMDSLTREVVTTMEYDALADHVDLNILADQFTTDEIAMATHITPEMWPRHSTSPLRMWLSSSKCVPLIWHPT